MFLNHTPVRSPGAFPADSPRALPPVRFPPPPPAGRLADAKWRWLNGKGPGGVDSSTPSGPFHYLLLRANRKANRPYPGA